MAIELETLMTGNTKHLTAAYSDVVIRAKGITTNFLNDNYNVKYLCKVVINGTVVATLKAPPNSNYFQRAHFRLQSILQDYTTTDKQGYETETQISDSTFQGDYFIDKPHSIHQIDKFARNKDNLSYCYCIGGKEYSTTPSGTIIQSFDLVTDVGFLFFNSVVQHSDGFSKQDFSDYILDGGQKKFLSIVPSVGIHPNGIDTFPINKLQLNQYHTIAFLNGKHYDDSEVTDIRIRTYDSSGTLIATQDVDNTNANGGAPFGSTIQVGLYGDDNTDEGLLYFGCGTAQLDELGFDMTNVSYYTVVARNGTSLVSKTYNFGIQQADCKGFETIRLAFLNRLGAYDYYNFTKRSVRRTEMVKSPMKQNYGVLSEHGTSFSGALSNDASYVQGTYDGGTRAYNVNAVETIEANTDFISETEADILKELFTSADVYMQTGDKFEPVVINETEYVRQTTANDKLIQYIIQVEKGHNTRVQRI